jgi:hypothetical protein
MVVSVIADTGRLQMDSNNPEEQRRVAYHEAGHALIAHLHGVLIDHILVDPEHENKGYVKYKKSAANIHRLDGQIRRGKIKRKYLYAWVLIYLAGIRTEDLIFQGGRIPDSEDTWLAKKLARRLIAMDGQDIRETGEYMKQATTDLEKMLSSHRDALDELAKRGLQQKLISDTDFLSLMKELGL